MILTGFIIATFDFKSLLTNKRIYLAAIFRLMIRAALIKQHKNVFGKRRSFGYAVSPLCRSFSMVAGSIPTKL